MKPICVPCQRFFRIKKTGISFIEGMPEAGAEPGTSQPDRWKPYKLWMGDKWQCAGCGAEIISGTGLNPIAEHYQEDFAEKMSRYQPDIKINDC